MTTQVRSAPTKSTTTAPDTFVPRHIGPRDHDIQRMLESLGVGTLDELIDKTVPRSIRLAEPIEIGNPRTEFDVLTELRALANKNKVVKSFIGQGYYDTIVPPVIQ